MQTPAPRPASMAGGLRRLSITRKLVLISAVYILIIAGLLAIAQLALGFLSDVRAYVGGEGLWSKSQKDAVYHLVTYVTLQREADYQAYLDSMQVPLGDRKARLELSRAQPDLAQAGRGFIEGRNHADDVYGMATLFRRFGSISYLARAIEIWGRADTALDDLRALAEQVRSEVRSGKLTKERQNELLLTIGEVNDRLTTLEDGFSFTLGEGARQIRRWVGLAMLLLTGIALLAGAGLSARISNQIGNGILTLRDGTRRVTAGDLGQAIAVDSADEIGELAQAFNGMTESLVRHITALEEAKAALAEMDRLKTQFFANVSHELRTPLTLILGPAQRLLESGAMPLELRRDAAVIERNAQLLRKHVNDLLDLSRLDAGHMETELAELDAARLVRRVASHFEALADERKVRFVVETPAAAPLAADPDKLERVLLNLLSNAFKFTPDGGTIALRLVASDAETQITVDDSGPGVPPELRAAIFERFRQGDGGATRRHGGTGLGLAIVKEFVALHHGSISVDSSPLGGAAFRCRLPRRAVDSAALTAALADRTPVGGPFADDRADQIERLRPYLEELAPAASATREIGDAQTGSAPETGGATTDPEAPLVLVVEDNPEMNRFIAETLAPLYRTASAGDGEEGLALARELKPDLVVSDVMMPRMSGDQLLAALRADPDFAGTPFLVLTAKADDALRVRLLREGAQDFLVKPFAAAELVTRAENLIAVRQARRALEDELHHRGVVPAAAAARESRRRRDLHAGLEKLHRSEVNLRLALQEKEVLVKEVHHRVKNNLQVIVSLLNLQRAQLPEGREATALLQCQERVRSMALIHEKLYQRGDLSHVDFGDYVRTLVANLHSAHVPAAAAAMVTVEVCLPEIVVAADVAIPCGLIVHELVSNALLHGFPDGRSGSVRIAGRRREGGGPLVLVIHDDGAGLPDGVDPHHPASLGLQLVLSLAAQLGGRVLLERSPGTTFTVEVAA